MEKTTGLSFSEALVHLENGRKIYCEYWKDCYIKKNDEKLSFYKSEISGNDYIINDNWLPIAVDLFYKGWCIFK
jgi:hypothetical protein